MFRILPTLLLFLGGVAAHAQTLHLTAPAPSATANPLTVENVMWAVFRLDPHSDPLVRARDFLEAREPQRYASNMHDPAALQAEAEVKAQELAERIAQVDPHALYTIDLIGLAKAVDGHRVRINLPFENGLHDLATDFGSTSPYLPPLYELLLVNAERYFWFEVSPGRAVELSQLIRDIGPQPAYLRLQLELAQVHQHHRIETVIRKVSWFVDEHRASLAGEVSDQRPAAELIAQRMLREGVTLAAVPEHAYSVADERILELLVENQLGSRTCKEQPRLNGHRQFLCEQEREYVAGLPVRAEYRYVGGRLVEVRVFGKSSATTAQLVDEVWGMARREHGSPPFYGDDGKAAWDSGGAHFRFDANALRAGRAGQPFYQATALIYADVKAGKPGTEVLP